MSASSAYLDTVFDALGARERRHSLAYLQEQPDNIASIDDVASYLSAETGQDRTTIMTSLTHSHLPKLADYGFIEYDQRIGDGDADTAIVDRTSFEDDRVLLDYLTDAAEQDDDHVDAVFDALADGRRREALYVLEYEQDRRSTLIGIANHLEPDPRTRGNTMTRLHNVDLPKLQESGWVQYDPTTQKVTLDIDPANDRDSLFLRYLEQTYDYEEVT